MFVLDEQIELGCRVRWNDELILQMTNYLLGLKIHTDQANNKLNLLTVTVQISTNFNKSLSRIIDPYLLINYF